MSGRTAGTTFCTFFLCIWAVLGTGQAKAQAADYLVAPTGADTNDGTLQKPFQTFARGLVALKPGDRLFVRPGVYRESGSLSVKGTQDQPVAVIGISETVLTCSKCGAQSRPAGGRGAGETEQADLCPKCGATTDSAVALPHIETQGTVGLLVADSTYVTVAGFEITGAAEAGILIARSDRVTVEGCAIADNAKWGVRVSLSDHVKVGKCEISGTRDGDGVFVSATEHPEVSDCRIVGNALCGVLLSGDVKEGGDGVVTGANVMRNTIIENGSKGGAAIRFEGVEKSTIENNVCDRNLAGGIECVKGAGARAGSRNKLTGNVVRFESGKGNSGIIIAEGATHSRLMQNTLVVGNGPELTVDEASAKGFQSSFNFFPAGNGDVTLCWQGRSMDLAGWKQATGQDGDSHAAISVNAPGPSAPEGGAKADENAD